MCDKDLVIVWMDLMNLSLTTGLWLPFLVLSTRLFYCASHCAKSLDTLERHAAFLLCGGAGTLKFQLIGSAWCHGNGRANLANSHRPHLVTPFGFVAVLDSASMVVCMWATPL